MKDDIEGIVIGVSLQLIGTSLSVVGMLVEKQSFAKEAPAMKETPEDQFKDANIEVNDLDPTDGIGYVKNRKWIAGFGIFIFGQILAMTSLPFCNPVILSCVSTFSLVVNVFLAHFILNEPATRRDVKYTGLIILGSVLAIAFAAREDGELLDMGKLRSKVSETAFIVWSTLFSVALIYCVARILYLHSHAGDKAESAPPSTAVVSHSLDFEFKDQIRGVASTQSAVDLRRTLKKQAKASRKLRAELSILFGFVTAGIGAIVNTLAKIVTELIETSSEGQPQFGHFGTYLVIGLLVVFAVAQIHALNMALAKFEAMVIIPLYSSLNLVLAVLTSMIFSRDFRVMSTTHIVFFTAGFCCTLFGVYKLARRKAEAERLAAKPDDGGTSSKYDFKCEDDDDDNESVIDGGCCESVTKQLALLLSCGALKARGVSAERERGNTPPGTMTTAVPPIEQYAV